MADDRDDRTPTQDDETARKARWEAPRLLELPIGASRQGGKPLFPGEYTDPIAGYSGGPGS